MLIWEATLVFWKYLFILFTWITVFTVVAGIIIGIIKGIANYIRDR